MFECYNKQFSDKMGFRQIPDLQEIFVSMPIIFMNMISIM